MVAFYFWLEGSAQNLPILNKIVKGTNHMPENEIIVAPATNPEPSIPEPAFDDVTAEVLYEETTSPIVPIVAALVSTAATALGFWLYGKIKARRAAKEEVLLFDPDAPAALPEGEPEDDPELEEAAEEPDEE